MNVAFGAVACWGIFVLAGVLLGGAVVVRGAVTLSNKFLGASSSSEGDSDEDEIDEWIGYRQIKQRIQGIPEPALGKGVLCVFLLTLVGLMIGLMMRVVFGVGPFGHDNYSDTGLVIIAHLFGFGISFPVSAWILASILPTRFGRACLVLLVNYAIILLIAVGIIGILYALF